MAKYIADIQDASGNTVYPTTLWGAITGAPAFPNMGNYYNKTEVDTKINAKTAVTTLSLQPVAGATDPCVVTVIGDTLVNMQFNGRYPVKGGQAVYWIDAKYAPKGNGVSFAIPHNNIEGTQMVISIGSNGAVVLVANSDDTSTAFGSYTYNCKA